MLEAILYFFLGDLSDGTSNTVLFWEKYQELRSGK
jgi:hypothetical protein